MNGNKGMIHIFEGTPQRSYILDSESLTNLLY